jgi:pentatricopeptide repeat protein
MLERDVSSWNTIISGYAQNVFCDYALYLFWQMKQAHVSPNNITFVSVLSACSYNGMLYESFSYFASMHLDHTICPQLEHYNNMIDLLARIGSFDLAECFIRNMPCQPTVISWMIFLSACKYHLDFEGASEAACFVLELDSTNFAPSVVLTSIHVATTKV